MYRRVRSSTWTTGVPVVRHWRIRCHLLVSSAATDLTWSRPLYTATATATAALRATAASCTLPPCRMSSSTRSETCVGAVVGGRCRSIPRRRTLYAAVTPHAFSTSNVSDENDSSQHQSAPEASVAGVVESTRRPDEPTATDASHEPNGISAESMSAVDNSNNNSNNNSVAETLKLTERNEPPPAGELVTDRDETPPESTTGAVSKLAATTATTTTTTADSDKVATKTKAPKEKIARNKTSATDADSTTGASKPPPPSATVATNDTAAVKKERDDSLAPSVSGGPPTVDGVKQYSTEALTLDAARHKAGLNDDPTRPEWQNPLHHNNPDLQRVFREDFESDQAFIEAQNPAPPLDDGSGRVVAPDHLHQLADEMVHLTMLEMNELINRVADHYGFADGMFSPDGGDGGPDSGGASGDDDDDDGDGAPAAAQEKTTFDIKLVSFDAAIKIKIIKEVRVIVPGLGLKEAKELVEGAPVALQKGVSKDVAEQIKAKLEELGAVMEIV